MMSVFDFVKFQMKVFNKYTAVDSDENLAGHVERALESVGFDISFSDVNRRRWSSPKLATAIDVRIGNVHHGS